MENKPSVFEFGVTGLPAGAAVDRETGVIKGVAVITGGVTAKGHDLEVDRVTLEQIVKCGKKKGRVQVKLNHKDPQALQSICGYVTNFRIAENKVLADWHLLKSHEEYEATIEKAERMPDCFGLSAAFSGPPKGEKLTGGKRAARCEELLAVDCVPMPAANPDGLFEAVVDSALKDQMDPKNPNPQEPTMADVLAAIQGLTTQVEEIVSRQDAIEAAVAENQPLSEEELNELLSLTDEELSEQGVTREQVQATLDAVYGDAAPGDTPADAKSAAAAPAAAAPAEAAALSALRRRVVELESKLGLDKESIELSEITQALDVLEEKHTAVCELAEKQAQQIEALQASLRIHGTKAAGVSASSVRMFSKEGSDLTEFEQIVADKAEELVKGGKDPVKAKSEAVQFAVKTAPAAYAEHRAAKGSVTLATE